MRELYKRRDPKLSAILCIVAFLICLTWRTTHQGMTVHAADQSARVTKQVNAYMTALKKYDIKKVRSMQIDKDVFHITDKNIQKYIRRVNRDHFTYEIKRVKIRGKSATVYMHVRQYSSFTDFINSIEYTRTEYKKSWSSKKFGRKLYERLNWAYETNTEPDDFDFIDKNIKIRLEKRGNKWMIPKMDKNIFILKDAGLTSNLDDFSKHPEKYL